MKKIFLLTLIFNMKFIKTTFEFSIICKELNFKQVFSTFKS